MAAGLLRARVVVGHDDHVGEPRGEVAHERPLAGVSVAAGPEDHDQPAVRERSQALEGGPDGVGLVCVVDDDRERLARVDPLEPARDPAAGGHRRSHRPGVQPGLAAGRHGGQRVAHVEGARERDPGLDVDARAEDAERRAVRTRTYVGHRPVRVPAPGREGAHRQRGLARQPPAVLVVHADEGEPGPLRREERGLGEVVVLLVGVEVEVVAAEVEEDRDVEDDAVDAAHHQRVAAHLHRAGGHLTLAHHREQRVQVGRLRRGERGLDVLPRDPGPDRADDARPDPRALQGALRQPGGGGLALGARHADHPHRGGRVAVHVRGEPAQEPPRLGHDQQRYAGRGVGGPGRVGEQGDRPRRQRVGGEGHPVRVGAGQGGVQVTGEAPLRAEGQPGDHRLEVAAGGDVVRRAAQPRRQVAERRLQRSRRPGLCAHHSASVSWPTTRRAGPSACGGSGGRRTAGARSPSASRTPGRP